MKELLDDEHFTETVKSAADVGSIGIVVGALMDYLPAVASFLSIVWVCIRIYETATVQKAIAKLFRAKQP